MRLCRDIAVLLATTNGARAMRTFGYAISFSPLTLMADSDGRRFADTTISPMSSSPLRFRHDAAAVAASRHLIVY